MTGRLLIVAALLTNIPTVHLVAQVGHDPLRSPFRDILLRSGPAIFVGHLSKDRGRAGAGPSNALTLGARYEMPAGRSLLLQFTAAYLRADRFIIDPFVDSTDPGRRTGPVRSDLLLADVGIELRLTGAKTWHGLEPYVGTALGFAFDINSPGDTTQSGYVFGTKLTLSGATGVRWYPSQRVHVNLDIRGQAWRLRYPSTFRTITPDGSRVVPLSEALTDWTLHPWISIGLGWTF